MLDRFRFRAYNKELRKMYEVDNICPYEDNHTKGGEVFLKGIQYNSFYFPEEVEVMQCTGLKDKNGKLIYEGDILSIQTSDDYIREKVYFMDCYATFIIENYGFLDRDLSNAYEVIGNIYENPGLL